MYIYMYICMCMYVYIYSVLARIFCERSGMCNIAWSVKAYVRRRRTWAPKAPIPRGVWGHAPPGNSLKCRTPQGGF